MKFDQVRYELFQKSITTRKLFRWFWLFWGLYGLLYVAVESLIIGFDAVGLLVLGLAFAAFIFARFVVSPLIYYFYKKPRPYQKFNLTEIAYSKLLSLKTSRSNSFPSDHVLSLAAINMVIVFYYPELGYLGFVVAILVGMGRVVLGYHYPIDVVAGFVLGCLCGWLVYNLGAPILFT